MKYALYWDWVKSEADAIGTDGCSDVVNFRADCCYQHDLAYHYAKDPGDAYRKMLDGVEDYWKAAKPFTKDEADAAFRRCIQAKSFLGLYDPVSWVRWAGVKFFAKKAWASHKETQNAGQV